MNIIFMLDIINHVWPCPQKLEKFQGYTFSINSNKRNTDLEIEKDDTLKIALSHKRQL